MERNKRSGWSRKSRRVVWRGSSSQSTASVPRSEGSAAQEARKKKEEMMFVLRERQAKKGIRGIIGRDFSLLLAVPCSRCHASCHYQRTLGETCVAHLSARVIPSTDVSLFLLLSPG